MKHRSNRSLVVLFLALLATLVVWVISFAPRNLTASDNLDMRASVGGPIWDLRWDPRLFAGGGLIEWFHNPANIPGSVNQGDFETEIEASFNNWEAVGALPGAPDVPAVNMGSPATAVDQTALDGINVVGWHNGTLSGAGGFLARAPCYFLTADTTTFNDNGETRLPTTTGSIPFPGPPGVTYPPGTAVDCWMEFDVADPWSTAAGPVPNLFDIQAIATHEGGHFLGVSHSTVGLPLDRNGGIIVGPDTATMVPTGGPNSIEFRSLAQDDIAAFLRTYSRNATPPAAQTAGGRGLIQFQLGKGASCEPATGVSVWAYATAEGLEGTNRVETFSGSQFRDPLGDPTSGSVKLNVPPGGPYTIYARTLEDNATSSASLYSAFRYSQTTIAGNTLPPNELTQQFDSLATVGTIAGGDTVDLGTVGILGCWVPVATSDVDIEMTTSTAPATGMLGGSIAVTSSFTNNGTAASGPFEADFYFSTDAVINTDDAAAGFTCSIAGLGVGASANCDGTIEVPAVAPGTYFVGALTDINNVIPEVDESNNALTIAPQVVISSDPTNPIVNGSFEDNGGGFHGWNLKELSRQSNPQQPLEVVGPGLAYPMESFQAGNWFLNYFNSEPTDGSWAAVHDFNGDDLETDPSTFVNRRELYQDLTLPAGTTTLLFDYRAAWELYRFGATQDRTFSVEVQPAGGGAPLHSATILLATVGGEPPSGTGFEEDTQIPTGVGAPYPEGAVDLSAWAAQDVRLVFVWNVPEPGTGFSFFQLDNVRLVDPGSNAAPTVTITAPADGSSVDQSLPVNFVATASDAEDGDLTASLNWTSNLDGAIGSGGSFSTAALSVGVHTITASVTDSLGGSGDDMIGLTINLVPNVAPTVVITAPADGATIGQGLPLNFTGTASDALDGDVTASLSWSSDLDGVIGSGGSFATSTLSVGTHAITALVTDSGGLPGSDVISLTIAAVLFSDDFGGTLANWTVVDEGTDSAPSNWFISGGELRQNSNISDRVLGRDDLPKEGTFAEAGNSGWTDYTFSAALRSTDNDAIGVMFRYQDPDNYYRFSMDSERGYRRLVKNEGGVFTLLYDDTVPYVLGQWYQLNVIASGEDLEVSLDGERLTVVTDTSHPAGRIALYGWGNNGMWFDNVTVVEGGEIAAPPNVTISSPVDGSGATVGTNVAFAGTAIDSEDGDLTASLAWASDIDGALGVGGSLLTALTEGVHRITASITDTDGQAGSDEVMVLVRSAGAVTEFFHDDFSGTLANWTIVDEVGTVDGPSNWFVSGGLLQQTSNINDGNLARDHLPKKATFALTGDVLWTDYTLTADLRSGDNDAIGLMFRYQDVDNYYRFSMDSQRGYRRLVKNENGVFTLLFEDAVPFALGQWYDLRVVVSGSKILIYIDDVLWAHVADAALPVGRIAAYAWGNTGISFDDVIVAEGIVPGESPSVTITSPADGSSVTEGSSVDFAGTASDPEDGDISTDLEWTSNLDGSIGSGGSFSTSALSVGAHTITAAVIDFHALPGSDTISLTIDPGANTAPSVTITAPATGASFTEGDSVSFAGTASDSEDGDITASLAWTSSLDGSIGSAGGFSTAGLTVGTHTITAAVTDSGGLPGSDGISVSIDPVPNTEPTVTITAPANGSTFIQGDSVNFTGSGTDTEDGDITASLAWTSSLDGAIGSGGSFLSTALTVGTHTITASLTDSGGLPGNDAISVTIDQVPNTEPTVTITAPANGSTFIDGDSVGFVGTATDTEDGDIAANLSWSSNLDGAIGSGAGFSTSALSVGTHTITAAVTDSGGLPGNNAISVTINANVAPTVTITAPLTGSTLIDGNSVSFIGTAIDTEDGDIAANLSWSSSLDGAIGSGGGFSTSALTIGTHVITASLTDSGGLPGSDAISVTIDPVPNTEPTVTITAPANGSTFIDGDSINFTGTATDTEDGDITASLAWTSSLDGPIGSVGGFSTAALTIGTHTITASLMDSGGIAGNDAISVTINPVPNTAPTVTITTPVNSSAFTDGDSVSFIATATDTEDGDIAPNLSWSSSLDGTVGSASGFSTSALTVGTHIITASLTDSGGLPANDAISVTIDPIPNTAPTVTITAPASGSTFIDGDPVSFIATATDTEDGDIAANLSWSSSLDGTIGSGGEFSTATLSIGIHTISASLTDSGGLPGNDAISVTIDPVPNTVPTVTITAPANGSSFVAGSSVSFAGTASDTEDGNISANLNWTSSLNGPIGSGAGFSIATLSVGTHTITASLTDSGGLPDDNSISVTISPNTAPTVTITAPATGSSFNQGTNVGFSGTATDTEDGDLAASLNWTSNLDGAIGSTGTVSTSTLSVGVHTITASLTDSGGLPGSDAISVTIATVPVTMVDNLTNADFSTPEGTISGSHLDTHVQDDLYEALTEEQQGRNSKVRSTLNHTWTLNLVAGTTHTFKVDAYHSPNSEGDNFTFAYSTDNSSFTNMLTVTKTADDDVEQTFALPSELVGTLYVRVVDTNNSRRNGVLDTLFVDSMAVTTVVGGGSNTAPVVTIIAPADASSFEQGVNIAFAATATDTEDGDISGDLTWASDLDGTIGSGASFLATLSAGSHTITASLTDTGGLPGSDAISVTVTPGSNDAPTVTITAPTNGSSFPSGDSINFAGTANDTEDGDITANLSWSSNLDGAIGSGGSFSTSTLSVGTHTITASLTDSGGQGGSDNIVVTVDPVGANITLSTSGQKVQGRHRITLTWTGATSANIDVYRNGSLLTTTLNDGSYTDNTGGKGNGSYSHQVCHAGSSTCSNTATTNF